MQPHLRPYQEAVVSPDGELVWALRKGQRRVLLCSPCGSGKTTIFSEIARRAVEKGNRVNIIAHRRRLIQQIAERLQLFGVDYTIEMATLPEQPWAIHSKTAKVRVCSRDTLLSRRDSRGLPGCDLVIIDECHISPHTYEKLIVSMGAKHVIGATATPCNSDGSGLSTRFWDRLISVTTIEHLIQNNWLSPLHVYAPPGVAQRRAAGHTVRVTGDPLQQWLRHANGLQTIIFCNRVTEAVDVAQQYRDAGIQAVSLDASSSDDERLEVFRAFQSGELTVIANCGIVGVGVDLPEIECVQLLTKCQSPSSMWQLTGRAARTCHERGKTHGVILDHAASFAEHGHPNVSPIWTLDDSDSVQNRQQNRMQEEPTEHQPVVCPACGMVNIGTGRCIGCNAILYPPKRKRPDTNTESLSRVEENVLANDPRQVAWRDILYSAARSGKTYKVASAIFKGRFGLYPAAIPVQPIADYRDWGKLVSELFPMYAAKKR